jgi:uncharacterized membrane protein
MDRSLHATNPTDGATSDAIRHNIELIARMEEKFLRDRNLAERIADAVGNFSGSVTFVLIHAIAYALWILINLRLLPVLPAFDPFPFMLLSMVVSLEAIFLSAFVLMKQNRMSRRADSRAHLDLQINLLAEREMTMVLQMLHTIGTRVGIRDHQFHDELSQFTEETPLETLATEIEDSMPRGV